MEVTFKKEEHRKIWLDSMHEIAYPVISNLSRGTLKASMPVEKDESFDRERYAHLEAFGRTLCGIAPWLECSELTGEEEALRSEYETLVHKCLDNATNESSPDYMNFCEGNQPLVDAAFLAHGLVRAQNTLIKKLSLKTKEQIIKALCKSRAITPGPSNWMLFSGMVETALYLLGYEKYDMLRIKSGLRNFYSHWYKGDGMYGDGFTLHMDYYNSFVIQPMLVDISAVFAPIDEETAVMHKLFVEHMTRYSQLLERFISPDGTYPIIGRSITYRFGAFQALSQSALEKILCEKIKPAQVRCGLTAIISRIMKSGIFDENGWLIRGVYGRQPSLAEAYICTGSLYLCCSVFLALGLPPSDEFWSGENEKWTSVKIAEGEDIICDHSISN